MGLSWSNGCYGKLLKPLAKIDFLVIDWWRTVLDNTHRRHLPEVLADRHGKRSTIVTSVPLDIGTPPSAALPLADGILGLIDAQPSDCPSYLLAPSGVVWTKWQGGNLPAFEDMTSQWQKSQSGFTMLAWMVVVFLVVVTAGAFAVAAGAGATALGPATFIQSLLASTATGVGGASLTMNAVLASAAIEAAAVGVVSGLAGATLNSGVSAPYSGATSGFGTPQVPSGEAARSVYDGVNRNFVPPPWPTWASTRSTRHSTVWVARRERWRPAVETRGWCHAQTYPHWRQCPLSVHGTLMHDAYALLTVLLKSQLMRAAMTTDNKF